MRYIYNNYIVVCLSCILACFVFISCDSDTNKIKTHNRINKVIPEISTAIHGVESKMQYEISEIISLSIPKDLGTISGIPQFINNRIFICDSQKKYVLVFDSNGNYLFKVGGVGHAQNEIIDYISDFDIDKSGYIHVYNRNGLKILIYDNNGEFVRSIRLNDALPTAIKILSNENYLASYNCYSSKSGKSELVRINNQGKLTDIVLSDPDENIITCEGSCTTPLFSDGDGKITYLSVLADSVIVFDADTVSQVVKFNFANDFPTLESIKALKKQGKIDSDYVIKYISKVQINDYYILLEFYASGQGDVFPSNYTYIFDKIQNKSFLRRGYFGIPNAIGHVVTFDDNDLVLITNDDDYCMIKDLFKFNGKNMSMKEYLSEKHAPFVQTIYDINNFEYPTIVKFKLK